MLKNFTFIVTTLAVVACESGSTSNGTNDSYSPVGYSIDNGNTCETAYSLPHGETQVRINTAADVWVDYKALTDRVQFDTCDTEQNGYFEVYHSCDTVDVLGTINGRGEQAVFNCYDGYYGEVLGIREKNVKIRFVSEPVYTYSYVVNIHEVGF